jgi:hypothetical protein
MIIAMALPSTKEAAVMTVVPAVAQSSIWYRLLGGGMDRRAVETARRLIRDGGQ